MTNLHELLRTVPQYELLKAVEDEAKNQNLEVYAVGGFVRDAILNRRTSDIDFVVLGQGSGIQLARAVGKRLGGAIAHVYPNFGTAAVQVENAVLEFVAARRESYRKDSRKPIVEDGTLHDDLLRRDFTVNTLALSLSGKLPFGELLDPFGGLMDLDAGRLRTPRSPGKTFADDPLRMIRAARFSAQLGFEIESEIRKEMPKEAQRLEIVSQERITDEFHKIMSCPMPSIGLKILEETMLLCKFFPELSELRGVDTVAGQRHKDNFYHTLQVVDNVVETVGEGRYWLRWAALLHDIGKPRSKRFAPGVGWTFHGHEDRGARMVPKLFRKLRLPTDERMAYVRKLIALHHRPVALVDDEVTDSAVRRLLFDAGEHIEDLMILVRADITSRNPHRVRRYLKAFDLVERKFEEVEAKDHLRNFQPPLGGKEIMEMIGIEAGIAVGMIKDAVREAILDGEIPNEHSAAFSLMLQIKDDALRRARLYEEVVLPMHGSERRAANALKEEIMTGKLPDDHQEALEYLATMKTRLLA
ncbi:MAG: HD domain-containing protein [Bacteroidetes bacterium]|nr:HD domain-containing protein [Bacteroidota bacterium]